MKHVFQLILFVTLFWTCSNESTSIDEVSCDNGAFSGSVYLETQQDVDEFGAMCYTSVLGDMQIGTFHPDYINSINDLSPLSSLTDTSHLTINGGSFTSLEGLHNITNVFFLVIKNCNQITDLSGLNSLETSEAIISITGNSNLMSFDGLENLHSVPEIYIADNPVLENINGLSNLMSVEYLRTYYSDLSGNFFGNMSLTNLCGLSNLFVNGTYNLADIDIQHNAYNPTVQDIIDGNCSQ